MRARITKLVFGFAFAVLFSSPGSAAPICSNQVCTIDGDTITIRDERIRIANIDAPEIGRPNAMPGGKTPPR
ncbi:hypothetical protein GCM10011491_42830 [Brucella endophytica]|uniref:Nuclease n=1 Tax=Brucella endophytica TaxID=1963359 RepID=A0A916WKI9_9HYPH|nr:hypothetical protein [Brucella endophytica]GGB10299.1 hypothetical protein GCM10011491_42830 [Brucella endophytica]